MSLVVHAAIGGFIAQEELEGFFLVGQGGEGKAEAGGFGEEGEFSAKFSFHFVHLVFEGSGLDEPDAAETPAGGDHFDDEFEFDVILWQEFLDERVE